jgi:hypothetical protein
MWELIDPAWAVSGQRRYKERAVHYKFRVGTLKMAQAGSIRIRSLAHVHGPAGWSAAAV